MRNIKKSRKVSKNQKTLVSDFPKFFERYCQDFISTGWTEQKAVYHSVLGFS